MSVRKFAGEADQEPFREWVTNRPRGYVLNTDSGLADRAGTRLHRANRFTLEPGFGGGTRQTADYIKVCSPDPKALNEWAVGNLGYGLRNLRCQHCDPTSLGLTD
jgi:putative salt-induced outer membrane protein YdiY